MKQVIVQAFCDGDHADRTPANVERKVAIDGSKTVVLDVCDSCDQMFQIMLGFMERGAVARDEDEDEQPERRTPRREQKRERPPGSGAPKGGKQRKPTKEQRQEARRTGLDPKNGMTTVCPECSFVSVSRSALGQHLSQHHNKRFGDYTDQQLQAARERAINMQEHAPRSDTPVAQSA